jgi:hypothetical protein
MEASGSQLFSLQQLSTGRQRKTIVKAGNDNSCRESMKHLSWERIMIVILSLFHVTLLKKAFNFCSEECGKLIQQSVPLEVKMAKQTPSAVETVYDNTLSTEGSKNIEKFANRTDIKISEVTEHGGTVYDNSDAQHKISQKSSKPENEPAQRPKEGDTIKIIQPSVPRSGSRKLPGLTKMLESDTESLQLDAIVSNEDSDDFDFSSDK